jgi:hypothetical protein
MLRGGIKDRFFHFFILFKFTILFFIHIFDIYIYIKKTLKTKKKTKALPSQWNYSNYSLKTLAHSQYSCKG